MNPDTPKTVQGEQTAAANKANHEPPTDGPTAAKLAADLAALLTPGDPYIDESKAKRLRREWDLFTESAEAGNHELDQLHHQFELLRQRVHKQVESRDQRYGEIEEFLTALKTAITDNDLQTSQQLEQKIINGLNRIRGLSSQRRQTIIQGLETLQPKIKKLAAWRHWGTARAREQIIEEIRNLHATEKDLEKVAQRIKRAREEWKQWDNSGEGGDNKLYKAFDEACTTAYEPCQKLFEQQRKQREAASKHRRIVCETLEDYYEKTDWEEPDWKAIQKLLREQTARWRKLGAAEYRDRKPLQKRYDEIIQRFNGPLDRERKRNFGQRRELIAAVEKLAELDDSRRAIAELQKLKRQWQVSVSGKRKQEQSIWKQFTAACDAVYERGRESRKAHDDELKAQFALKQALCEEIEAACKVTDMADTAQEDTSPRQLQSRIKSWRQRWKESGRAPKSRAKQIDKRYREAIKSVERLHKQQLSEAQASRDKHLLEGAALCAELEAAILGRNAAPDAAAIEKYGERWQALLDTDSSTRELIESLRNRYDMAIAAATDESARQKLAAGVEDNFDQINTLLLQLEIRAEVDSPAPYARQRMALQINRLSAAMGKGEEQQLSTNELVQRIHTIGAVSPEHQQQIDQRFTNCYQALQNDHNQTG